LDFNPAISQMMIFTNHYSRLETYPKEVMEDFCKLLSPYAPNSCEELWKILGHDTSISLHDWPEYDISLLVEKEVEVLVQVGGKPRFRLNMRVGLSEEEMRKSVLSDERTREIMGDRAPKKVICIPGRLVNIVQ
ncbi:MAG: class I tRNA ligase family protein, partial [Planctomycetes bacterium]|nr:class I tRNA ligase family protein [Planctomycetota bacterium]